jgi:hypothetical protein
MEHAAAGTFIGLGLELGGKHPAYVRGSGSRAVAAKKKG